MLSNRLFVPWKTQRVWLFTYWKTENLQYVNLQWKYHIMGYTSCTCAWRKGWTTHTFSYTRFGRNIIDKSKNNDNKKPITIKYYMQDYGGPVTIIAPSRAPTLNHQNWYSLHEKVTKPKLWNRAWPCNSGTRRISLSSINLIPNVLQHPILYTSYQSNVLSPSINQVARGLCNKFHCGS